jgi:hypothetical protein
MSSIQQYANYDPARFARAAERFSHTSATAGTVGTAGADANLLEGPFSPEMIIAYCARELGSINESLNGLIKSMNASKQVASAMSKLQGILEKYPNGIDFRIDGNDGDSGKTSDNTKNKKACHEVVSELETVLASLPPDSPYRREIETLKQRFEKAESGTGLVPKGEFVDIKTKVGTWASDAGNAAETNSMKMSQLANMRQYLVTSCSGLLANAHQTCMAAINNMAR